MYITRYSPYLFVYIAADSRRFTLINLRKSAKSAAKKSRSDWIRAGWDKSFKILVSGRGDHRLLRHHHGSANLRVIRCGADDHRRRG